LKQLPETHQHSCCNRKDEGKTPSGIVLRILKVVTHSQDEHHHRLNTQQMISTRFLSPSSPDMIAGTDFLPESSQSSLGSSTLGNTSTTPAIRVSSGEKKESNGQTVSHSAEVRLADVFLGSRASFSFIEHHRANDCAPKLQSIFRFLPLPRFSREFGEFAVDVVFFLFFESLRNEPILMRRRE
jgi:hypothetical protein